MNPPGLLPLSLVVAVCPELTGEQVLRAAVSIGTRVEVQVTHLPQSAAGQLGQWCAARDSGAAPAGWAEVALLLRDSRQRTTKGSRSDCTEDFDELMGWPGLGDLWREALSGDVAAARSAADVEGARVSDAPGGYVVSVDGPRPWPDLFGGPAQPGERLRTVDVSVATARWRDRRLRRLAGVQVRSQARWPVYVLPPAPARPPR